MSNGTETLLCCSSQLTRQKDDEEMGSCEDGNEKKKKNMFIRKRVGDEVKLVSSNAMNSNKQSTEKRTYYKQRVMHCIFPIFVPCVHSYKISFDDRKFRVESRVSRSSRMNTRNEFQIP
jgi:hypothetical protein